jgi:preprotein translocase subunit SecA
MLKWLGSLVDSNERELKRLQPLVARINALEPEFERLSSAELHSKTDGFKARYQEKKLDELLSEAFAAVREAARRTIGLRHFDVQLVGGIVLHQGKIAEMKTGEGKTLVATLPLYLNSITGEGCHLVTVNDYLAKRDCQWMGPIYHALGVSVASIVHQDPASPQASSYVYDPDYDSGDPRWRHLRPVSRRQAYEADITYGTNNEFGFDYLRDNMVIDLSQCVQRTLNYAIVDEVDYILIDESRTPLIISGAAEESAQKYATFARLVPQLVKETDYTVDEKLRAVSITDNGIAKMERLLKQEGLLKSPDLYDPSNYALTHYLESALKAHVLFRRDKDYVVTKGKDGPEVVIVDEFTGRLMPGRRYSEGLHQAIEAKERVKVQRESVTLATITFQNYFRLYKKLAGMTGTAATEAEELEKIYKLEVVAIPTNEEMIRDDYPDQIYKTEEAKFKAVCNEIEKFHAEQRPVLIGTTSIEKSELLSGLLQRRGIPHQVLNAKLHEKEASIIAQAGKLGAVTVATNMAGRGVDIILGGEPQDYRPYNDVNDYILKETTEFIDQGVIFLKEQQVFKGWEEALLENLTQTRNAISLQEETIRQKLRDYQEASNESDNAKLPEITREIDQQEQILKASLEKYQALIDSQADEIYEELKTYLSKAEKPSILQRIRSLIDARENAKQGKRTTAEVLLERRKRFFDWLENHRQVMDLGGLHVIGTEKHEARRIDNQLRGRSGRQGDLGSSRFYVSLEDDVVRRFGGDRVRGFMEWAGIGEDVPIEHSLVSKAIESSQVRVEGHHFEIRKHLVDYDDVVNKHREVIYEERKKILNNTDIKTHIQSMIRDELSQLVAARIDGEQPDIDGLLEDANRIMPLPPELNSQTISQLRPEEIEGKLIEYAASLYDKKEEEIGANNMRILERLVMLRVMDNLWTEHLTMMDHMRQGIGLQAVGQNDPLVAYKKEGHALFQSLLANIQHDLVNTIYRVDIVKKETAKAEANKRNAVPANKTIGRNDPCPCGSGKKYKKCCGK